MNFYNDFIRSGEVAADNGMHRVVPALAYGGLLLLGGVLASCAPPPSEFRRPAL